MISMHVPRTSAIFVRWPLLLVVMGLGPLLVLTAMSPTEAGESGASDQCVACHTDAAKLKALTPPDPPPSEEGEG